jgi:hypothetical protein
MTPKLKEKVEYSPGESRVLAILTERKVPITSTELAEIYYYQKEMPEYGRGAALSAARSLQRKARRNHERFDIDISDARGPRPVMIHLRRLKLGEKEKHTPATTSR